VQRCHERGLPHDPCAVFRDHLVAQTVAPDHEWIAPRETALQLDALF
jgi:hypothetical protein